MVSFGIINASQVDQWLELALVRLSKKVTDEEAFNAALRLLDAHLTLRTFFVGYGVTLADIGVWGALKLHPLWAKASQAKHANEHLVRYCSFSFYNRAFCVLRVVSCRVCACAVVCVVCAVC